MTEALIKLNKNQTAFGKNELLTFSGAKQCGLVPSLLSKPSFIIIDRILDISDEAGKYGLGHVVAETKIHSDQWFFKGHFVDDPVMPASLALDALWQLMYFWLAWQGSDKKYLATGLKSSKFTTQIIPSNNRVEFNIDIKSKLNSTEIYSADGHVLVDNKSAFLVSGMSVGVTDFSQKSDAGGNRTLFQN